LAICVKEDMYVWKAGKEEERRKQFAFPARTTHPRRNLFDAPMFNVTIFTAPTSFKSSGSSPVVRWRKARTIFLSFRRTRPAW
jgi:hypothetical protein